MNFGGTWNPAWSSNCLIVQTASQNEQGTKRKGHFCSNFMLGNFYEIKAKYDFATSTTGLFTDLQKSIIHYGMQK